MDEQDKAVVNTRKLQENRADLIKAGLHIEMAKWHKALYDAYLAEGFSAGEALELVKAAIK
jgi:hypothetical protein